MSVDQTKDYQLGRNLMGAVCAWVGRVGENPMLNVM